MNLISNTANQLTSNSKMLVVWVYISLTICRKNVSFANSFQHLSYKALNDNI